MSEPTNLTKVEYRVRKVERFIVTRYEEGHDPEIEEGPKSWKASTTHGEFDNPATAYEVGYALAGAEARQHGWGPGDERMQYPRDEQPGQADISQGAAPEAPRETVFYELLGRMTAVERIDPGTNIELVRDPYSGTVFARRSRPN